MRKNHISKTITLVIIFLFIGVSVSSAVSVKTKSTISNNQNEECRECQEISKSDLIRVERLLDRVEVYSKLLLVLSKFNPELRQISEELSNEISIFREIDWYHPICEQIIDIYDYAKELMGYYIVLAGKYAHENGILFLLMYVYIGIAAIYFIIGITIGYMVDLCLLIFHIIPNNIR